MLTRRHLLAGAGVAAVTAAASRAGAQSTYASQPVHILVGYAAGGGVDIVARLLQEPLKAALGQPIIIENRTGASAMLATGAVAKAAPDGYTLLACASGEVAINHFLFKEKMAYDPAKELVPIALIGIVPCVVVVASATPVHNPKELIAFIKENPGKLSFSSSGIGNPQQLAGELMNTMAGTKVLHVPYRGSAPAVTDVATGAITMSFASLAAALPLIQGGKIRAVAVTSRERMPKSKAGSRDIPLAPIAVNALRQWRSDCPVGPLGLVFPGEDGGVESYFTIRSSGWIPLQLEAGICTDTGEAKYSFHALRHAAASLFIAYLNWTPKRLQSVMGHASIAMTFDRYGHLFADHDNDREAMEKLQAAVGA